MKELLLQSLYEFTGVLPHQQIPAEERPFYGPDHDTLTEKLYNSYKFGSTPSKEHEVLLQLFNGKSALIGELFSGKGNKIEKILNDLLKAQTEDTFVDYSGFEFHAIDYKMRNMDTRWVKEWANVLLKEADVFKGLPENEYDLLYICLDNPTLGNFPANKVSRLFQVVSKALVPGGYFLFAYPPINPYPNVQVMDPLSLGVINYGGEEKVAYGIRGSKMHGYEFEQNHDAVILGDIDQTVGNFVPTHAFYFTGIGNYPYSKTVFEYFGYENNLYENHTVSLKDARSFLFQKQ